jgi:hypothetical protein
MQTAAPGSVAAPRPPNSKEREALALLREAFQHSRDAQQRFASWWDAVKLADRRLLLAFCGLDDSEESARRKWHQLRQADRELFLGECRHLLRVLSGLFPALRVPR